MRGLFLFSGVGGLLPLGDFKICRKDLFVDAFDSLVSLDQLCFRLLFTGMSRIRGSGRLSRNFDLGHLIFLMGFA